MNITKNVLKTVKRIPEEGQIDHRHHDDVPPWLYETRARTRRGQGPDVVRVAIRTI